MRTELTVALDSLRALIGGEDDPVVITANAAAFIFQTLDRVNWAGFYRTKGDGLLLGPFCGKPACTRIARGRGVCGTALEQRRAICVDDVHSFPGHIACDADSRSEFVAPVFGADGEVVAVLDVDSPVVSRFGEDERDFLSGAADAVGEALRKNGTGSF